MASSDISEESSDWEEIQYPYSVEPSDYSPKVRRLDHEPVIRENFYDDGSAVSPPSDHEGLPLEPDECEPPENTGLITSSMPLSGSGTDQPWQQQRRGSSKLVMIMGRVRARMCMMREKMSAFVGTGSGSCPSPLIAPAAALAVAVFACVRILKWRKQVMLLMREKDQRISQLLNQIAHMREMLSARRRVPVLRIN